MAESFQMFRIAKVVAGRNHGDLVRIEMYARAKREHGVRLQRAISQPDKLSAGFPTHCRHSSRSMRRTADPLVHVGLPTRMVDAHRRLRPH